MRRPLTIRQSLLRDLIVMMVVMGGLIMGATFFGSRRAVRTLSATIIRQTLDTAEGDLRAFFNPVVRELRVACSWGEGGSLDLTLPPSGDVGPTQEAIRKRLTEQFIPLLEEFTQVSSLLVADTKGHEYMLLKVASGYQVWQTRPDDDDQTTREFSWSSGPAVPQQTIRTYDPRTRPWHVGALEKRASDAPRSINWTQPYQFFTTQQPGITASASFVNPDGEVYVIGFDILLNAISDFTLNMTAGSNGKVIVLTDDQRVVGLPQHPRFNNPATRNAAYLKVPEEIGIPLLTDAGEAFREAINPRPNRQPGDTIISFRSKGRKWWGDGRILDLASDRILWIGVMVPESDLTGNLNAQRAIIISIVALVLVVGVWRAVVLARRFSRPVEALVSNSDRISRGDLEPGEPIDSPVSEIQSLASAQDRMRQGLQSLMKLERDLQLARQIQQSTFPDSLPKVDGFEIDAWSEPAEETGGDTFDVIGYTFDVIEVPGGKEGGTEPQLSNGHVERAVLLLADATGHGIGPALSAAQVRGMLRMAVRAGANLSDMVRHLNEQLFDDLPADRFVTAWLGELDGRMHRITSFSAGQAPILHYRASTDDFVQSKADMPPLGIVGDLVIEIPAPLDLQRGDVFAVISDGIFEAMDENDDLFGADRVTQIIRAQANEGPIAITKALRTAVTEFTSGAPAADDRTAILIKRV